MVMRRGHLTVRASHDLSGLSVRFDESNLVPGAGLVPAALLAQRVGLAGLVNQRVTLARHGAHGGTKTLTVLGSMLTAAPASTTLRCCARARSGCCSTSFATTRPVSAIGRHN